MVGPMDGPGAGQSGGWRQRGLEARAALAETWGGLADVTDGLSKTEWARPTGCPGWDVKDQLSHLIGIERSLMGQSAPVWTEPFGPHVKNDFAASNEPWVAVRRAKPGAAVREEFVEVTQARLAQLQGLTEAEWAAVGWSPVGEVPHAVLMEVRVFDSWVHEQDVRHALDRPGGAGNRASALSLERVQGAMPFVVGKQAGCPDGSVVRFEVSGPGEDARVFVIAVEQGRARPVSAQTPPSAMLSLTSVDFMRLGCGRVTAGELESPGMVAVAGDVGLGQRVLGAMNFMF